MIQVAIGIDPGYATCGLFVAARDSTQAWTAAAVRSIETSAGMPIHERMRVVFKAFQELDGLIVVRNTKRAEMVVACEEQTGPQEGNRRRGSASATSLYVQQVVGFARLFSFDLGCAFVEPTPGQAKKVLAGIKPDATKQQVQRAVRAIIAGCPEKMTFHASDAGAIALAGARMVPVR